jgi:hypothetical protein
MLFKCKIGAIAAEDHVMRGDKYIIPGKEGGREKYCLWNKIHYPACKGGKLFAQNP